MNVRPAPRWADRLSRRKQITAIAIASLLLLFAISALLGFSVAIAEHGAMPRKPLAYIVFALMVGVAVALGSAIGGLVRAVRRQPMSGFDRRYWKMWAVILALGVLVGIAFGMIGISGSGPAAVNSLFSNAPVAPVAAGLLAAALVALMTVAAVYYHRTIDDHEERAYLWGSTLAFYFLSLAFPVQWMLARGGLVPPLTIGVALVLVLLSFLIQALVWASFKFR